MRHKRAVFKYNQMKTQKSQAVIALSDDAKQALYSNRWFAGLPASLQTTLLASCRSMQLKEGQLFCAQGQNLRKRHDGFAVLVQGLIKVASTSTDGREAILGFVRPGQWFGELAVIDGAGRERDFFCVEACQLLVVETEQLQLLLQDPLATTHITRLLASRTRALLSLVEDFSLRNTLARTARRLVMLAYDDEPQSGAHRQSLDVSQDALASMLGVTRQSVASQLRQLSAHGAIEQAYGRVVISSMVALMAQAA
jgi:CRP/FNR family transcriptional regulator, cyclic AMP receptor protein